MGKPFQSELNQLGDTIRWASTELLPQTKPTWLDCTVPAYCIGSGGSQSAADFLARLIRFGEGFAWATTPLEYLHLGDSSSRSSAFLMSANGKNKDIMAAAKLAVRNESVLIGALTTRKGSPLAAEIGGYSAGSILELDTPSGKDGFLATNSLIAMMLALLGMSAKDNRGIQIAELCKSATEVANAENPIEFRQSEPEVIIIYAGWAGSAALDLESKLSEAALAPAMLCDIRSFGHGRHLWLAKRPAKTLIVTLEDEQHERLFGKTLALIPSEVQVIRLKSHCSGPSVAIDLTLRVFGLVRDFGNWLDIDPGRPSVPEFGRKIYHLSPTSTRNKVSSDVTTAAQRRIRSMPSQSADLLPTFESAANEFKRRIHQARIRAVVLDYDGTLVDTFRRFDSIDSKIVSELRRLLKAGIFLGVATGRGKSVREPLREALQRDSWSRVLVGYYNGSQNISLGVDLLPVVKTSNKDPLVKVERLINEDPWISAVGAKVELRPNQLSVSVEGCSNANLWMHITRLLTTHERCHLKCVASKHSVDILPQSVSKLSLVKEISQLAGCRTENVLCIGDAGYWPGNDSELLSHFPSLSSGTSANDLSSGWNLAPPGILESKATLHYLQCLAGADAIRLSLGS